MEDSAKEYLTQTKDLLKKYVEKRLELLRMQTTLSTSKAVGIFFSILIVFFLLLLTVIFAGMWLSFWLSEKTGSYATGFGASTGFFVLIFVLVLVFRKKLIQVPVANTVASEIEEEDDINIL